MAGDDQADAEELGERCEFLGRAGTLAIGSDHHWRQTRHHQPCCQLDHGQCLAGARRPDQKQWLLTDTQRKRAERDDLGQGICKITLTQRIVQGRRHIVELADMQGRCNCQSIARQG